MASRYVARFVNQNPRNLELMGIQYRPSGNCFEKNRKKMNAIYKTVFNGGKSHTEASVYHYKTGLVLSVSTRESGISNQLPSTTDRFAAFNIGKVLADRLKQCGIEMVVPCFEEGEIERSHKKQFFVNALLENGIKLMDYSEVEPSIKNNDITWSYYKRYHTRQEKIDEQF
ncbi:39S ribosomal protein L18, mitochondrial [Strongyloides ratti]|uniref:39S ribosomal protein L18, mitochondrial n=1 Tax=Strongyloides ratti TaxID=34506 RepID=A0A090L9E5_STRRB|nr:39S ribosomal protein L18, mitochondrial [Strongyloides ratti]CEF66411.1 39S ribosomal protein L18, mitochondrial [Strongyloides ratti]